MVLAADQKDYGYNRKDCGRDQSDRVRNLIVFSMYIKERIDD